MSASFAQAVTEGASTKPAERPATAQGELRFIAWNVQFGCRGTPEEIGDMLKTWQPDVVAFNEVPGGDWTARVGKRCGMQYAVVGKISSADMMGTLNPDGSEGGYFKGKEPKTPGFKFEPNKYKSILSRTPLSDAGEEPITGLGWQPASAMRAKTLVGKQPLTVYSLHIAGDRSVSKGTQAADLATRVLPKEAEAVTLVMGDFNHPRGPAMDVFKDAGFTNMWDALKMDLAKEQTWSAIKGHGSLGVIDHILFNHPDKVQPVRGGIIELEKPLSDHKPVWGDFRFG